MRKLLGLGAALASLLLWPAVSFAMAPPRPAATVQAPEVHLAAAAPVAIAASRARTIDGHVVLGSLRLTATAYAPTLQDNYPYGAVDYFGRPLVAGDVAVDPSVIPLGTLLWVTGYRSPDLPAGGFLARAVDTGDAIQGHRLDIFINASESEVSNFGIQQVHAYILGK